MTEDLAKDGSGPRHEPSTQSLSDPSVVRVILGRRTGTASRCQVPRRPADRGQRSLPRPRRIRSSMVMPASRWASTRQLSTACRLDRFGSIRTPANRLPGRRIVSKTRKRDPHARLFRPHSLTSSRLDRLPPFGPDFRLRPRSNLVQLFGIDTTGFLREARSVNREIVDDFDFQSAASSASREWGNIYGVGRAIGRKK